MVLLYYITFTVRKLSVFGVLFVCVFPHLEWIRTNTPYSVSLRIQSKCREMQTRKTPNTDTFYAMNTMLIMIDYFITNIYWVLLLLLCFYFHFLFSIIFAFVFQIVDDLVSHLLLYLIFVLFCLLLLLLLFFQARLL